MASLFDLGLQGYNYYQLNENFDDAQHDLDQGFARARGDITRTQQPYVDFGIDQMEGYSNLGEFGFDYDNYLGSENYDWLVDEGLRGVQRTAAGNKMLQSGNTLASLNERNINLAQSMYGQEHARQLAEHEANRDYWGTGLKVGADTATNLGNNLADIGIGEGASKASLHASQAQTLSRMISSTGAAISPTVPAVTAGLGTGLVNQIADMLGIGGSQLTLGDILDAATNGSLPQDMLEAVMEQGGPVADWVENILPDWGQTNQFGNLPGRWWGSNYNDDGTIFEDPLQDFWSDASPWDDPELMLGDDGWWDSFTQSIGDIWDDTGGALIDWASDFFR